MPGISRRSTTTSGTMTGGPGRHLRHNDRWSAAQGDRPGRPHWLGLLSRPYQRQAADRHRGAPGPKGAAAKRRQKRNRTRSAMRLYRNAPSRWGLRKSRLYLRSVLERANIDPAVGGRRHQLVADVIQPRHRQLLRARHRAHQRLRAIWRHIQKRETVQWRRG